MPLFSFQQRVADSILAGRNVILQAPTGAGKTRAALTPFIHAWRYGDHRAVPTKCLYAVPMRVLADQFHEAYKESFDSFTRRWGWDGRRKPRVTLQTGEQSQDPRLEGDLIFATIDQVLSSFLLMPYSLSLRQANLNAGAVAGAYLVFDEFHLFAPNSTLPTTLDMLRRLKGLAPMLLMTATFSAEMLGELAAWLAAEIVTVPQNELPEIPSQNNKQRFYHTGKDTIGAEAVLAQHQRRSLVVCNTVQRAQGVYRDLVALTQGSETRVLLLHSRFLPEDRKAHEETIRNLFGKEDDGAGSVIAVATQVIEVGLDITCETLHTELAPANAILQRAGRCTRFPGPGGQTATGHVVVYPVENYQPYRDDGLQEACERTWAELQARDNTIMDFSAEQALINAVHSARDREILDGLRMGSAETGRRINAILAGERRDGANSVREVASRAVTVHDAPDALLAAPWRAPAFSLHPGSLFGMFKDWQTRAAGMGLPWAVKRLEETEDAGEGGRGPSYRWVDVDDGKQLQGAVLLAVNNRLAGYDPGEGFLPDRDTGFRAGLPEKPGTAVPWRVIYTLESYAAHVQEVCKALAGLPLEALAYPAAALEKRAGWPAGSLAQAAWAVAALHDVGKLTTEWQGWARAWQTGVGNPLPAGEAAAHTDYDGGNPAHRRLEGELAGKRPPHAVEGAVATLPLLMALFKPYPDVLRAAFTAIARHHGPFTASYKAFRLDAAAPAQIATTCAALPDELAAALKGLAPMDSPELCKIDDFFVRPQETDAFIAYTLLSRALRLADQAGTRAGSGG
ncbi:MAG: CRISPR-associated helicase Cas3' [Anaerolineae bacterium]|nr:CRISPR-associated helicase Cas3' [Anaerolineae bacterium]